MSLPTHSYSAYPGYVKKYGRKFNGTVKGDALPALNPSQKPTFSLCFSWEGCLAHGFCSSGEEIFVGSVGNGLLTG